MRHFNRTSGVGRGDRDGTPMGHGRRFAGALLALAIVAAAALSLRAQSVTVRIEPTEAAPGLTCAVPVLIDNSIPIASVIVPIHYPASTLFPDSVTFRGSVVSPDHLYLGLFSYDSSLVRIIVLPNIISPMPIIYDPGGLLATIWFTVSPFPAASTAILDTMYVSDSICFRGRCFYYCPVELQASDAQGRQIYPSFIPSQVTVLRKSDLH